MREYTEFVCRSCGGRTLGWIEYSDEGQMVLGRDLDFSCTCFHPDPWSSENNIPDGCLVIWKERRRSSE